jgi:mono/diheme cytochrome c family protein
MLDKGKCVSSSDSAASDRRGASLRRAARLGARAVGLGAIIALTLMGSALRAGAKCAASDDLGEKTFKTTCVMCHGQDGTGTPTGKALKAPDLHSQAVQKMTDAQIMEQISNGKNNMPPFKNTLTKDQIQALAKYIRTFGRKK